MTDPVSVSLPQPLPAQPLWNAIKSRQQERRLGDAENESEDDEGSSEWNDKEKHAPAHLHDHAAYQRLLDALHASLPPDYKVQRQLKYFDTRASSPPAPPAPPTSPRAPRAPRTPRATGSDDDTTRALEARHHSEADGVAAATNERAESAVAAQASAPPNARVDAQQTVVAEGGDECSECVIPLTVSVCCWSKTERCVVQHCFLRHEKQIEATFEQASSTRVVDVYYPCDANGDRFQPYLPWTREVSFTSSPPRGGGAAAASIQSTGGSRLHWRIQKTAENERMDVKSRMYFKSEHVLFTVDALHEWYLVFVYQNNKDKQGLSLLRVERHRSSPNGESLLVTDVASVVGDANSPVRSVPPQTIVAAVAVATAVPRYRPPFARGETVSSTARPSAEGASSWRRAP